MQDDQELSLLPPYLLNADGAQDAACQTQRTYGTLSYNTRRKCWMVKGDPMVTELCKRLFPGSDTGRRGEARFTAHKRIIGELNWLMLRYPLLVLALGLVLMALPGIRTGQETAHGNGQQIAGSQQGAGQQHHRHLRIALLDDAREGKHVGLTHVVHRQNEVETTLRLQSLQRLGSRADARQRGRVAHIEVHILLVDLSLDVAVLFENVAVVAATYEQNFVDSVAHKSERHVAYRFAAWDRINCVVHHINRFNADKSKKYCVYLLRFSRKLHSYELYFEGGQLGARRTRIYRPAQTIVQIDPAVGLPIR